LNQDRSEPLVNMENKNPSSIYYIGLADDPYSLPFDELNESVTESDPVSEEVEIGFALSESCYSPADESAVEHSNIGFCSGETGQNSKALKDLWKASEGLEDQPGASNQMPDPIDFDFSKKNEVVEVSRTATTSSTSPSTACKCQYSKTFFFSHLCCRKVR
jgi:hypothetical protein